ncbi:hypothetical protein JCM8547_006866 [Rhodosporidiobolus lusitaniae]
MVLTPDTAADPVFLPHLSSLRLVDVKILVLDPFHPLHWSSLDYYPSLTELDLCKVVLRPSLCLPRPFPLSFPALSHITSLSLESHLSPPFTAHFIALFCNLEHLSILEEGSGRTSYVCTALSAVPNPSKLQSLRASSMCFTIWSIGDLLPRFTSLSSLTMEECHSYDEAFYRSLRLVPLKSLTFDTSWTLNVVEDLAPLVSGPDKHPSLVRLFLDHVQVKIGTSIHDRMPEFDEQSGKYEMHRDWDSPQWNLGFAPNDMMVLLKAAEENGVELGTDVRRAIECSKMYWKEVDKLEEMSKARRLRLSEGGVGVGA